MKIPELIAHLEAIRKTCGDLPVQVNLYERNVADFVQYDINFVSAEGMDRKGTKIALFHINR